MKSKMSIDIATVTLVVWIAMAGTLSAQTPTTGGTINSYLMVREVSDYGRKIYVDVAAGVDAGDWLLLMQNQGAGSTREEDCEGPTGSITSYDAAGNFELVRVKMVNTTPPSPFNTMDEIELEEPMKMFYHACFDCEYRNTFPRGSKYGFQAVVVPYFDGDVNITSDLTPLAWDGEKGGVVALVAQGTVRLMANINASGMGFRGGAPSDNNSDVDQMDYSSDPGDNLAGRKGEGITDVTITAFFGDESAGRIPFVESAGRGALANGGGGGNGKNAGGGGGSNYGAGGRGGKQNFAEGDLEIGGEGGWDLAYPDKLNSRERKRTQVFFGGGGGGGHCTEDGGGIDSKGGAGGGIVLILADRLYVQNEESAGRWIVANGNPGMPGVSGLNGGGGGGAGGVILLDVNEIEVDMGTLTVQAMGGNGGNSYGGISDPRTGPGGGGGGGVLWLRGATTPGIVDWNTGNGTLQGGNAGESNTTSSNVYGAEAGEDGAVLHNLTYPKWYAPDESPI